MPIYLSAGPSTIAALMVVDRIGAEPGRPGVAAPDEVWPKRERRSAPPEAEASRTLKNECAQIKRRCERAVVTAYRDLRTHGTAASLAFQACTKLYQVHHPEASLSEARSLVAEWTNHHLVRPDTGQTPGCSCDEDELPQR